MTHPCMDDDGDPLLARLRECCAALPEGVGFESVYRQVDSTRMIRALDAAR